MRIFPRAVVFASLAAASLMAQTNAPVTAAVSPLPAAFAGWEKRDSAAFTPQGDDAAVLKELKLEAAELASYTRTRRSMKVKLFRFADATGAYGAYTYFRKPGMAKEKLCNAAASNGPLVVFYCGNLFIQVEYDRITAMSASEMRALVEALPKVSGNIAEPPNLPLYLPPGSWDEARFSIGPEAFSRMQPAFPAALVDFKGTSAEAVTAPITTFDGAGALTILKFPTPQLAALKEKTLLEWWSQQPKAAASPDDNAAVFQTKRVGPLVGVVTGSIAASDAENILERIEYDAEITWSEATGAHPKENIGNLVYNVIILAFIMGFLALIFGLAFGGFRVMADRFLPGKIFRNPKEQDIIRLNIDE